MRVLGDRFWFRGGRGGSVDDVDYGESGGYAYYRFVGPGGGEGEEGG